MVRWLVHDENDATDATGPFYGTAVRGSAAREEDAGETHGEQCRRDCEPSADPGRRQSTGDQDLATGAARREFVDADR